MGSDWCKQERTNWVKLDPLLETSSQRWKCAVLTPSVQHAHYSLSHICFAVLASYNFIMVLVWNITFKLQSFVHKYPQGDMHSMFCELSGCSFKSNALRNPICSCVYSVIYNIIYKILLLPFVTSASGLEKSHFSYLRKKHFFFTTPFPRAIAAGWIFSGVKKRGEK